MGTMQMDALIEEFEGEVVEGREVVAFEGALGGEHELGKINWVEVARALEWIPQSDENASTTAKALCASTSQNKRRHSKAFEVWKPWAKDVEQVKSVGGPWPYWQIYADDNGKTPNPGASDAFWKLARECGWKPSSEVITTDEDYEADMTGNTWPDKSGLMQTPRTNSVRNVEWYLRQRGIETSYNEFDLNTYITFDGHEAFLKPPGKVTWKKMEEADVRKIQLDMN